MQLKLYESNYEGGSCIKLPKIIYSENYIIIDSDYNYIIIKNKKYNLINPKIQKIDYKYNFGGFIGPQNIKGLKYSYNLNGDILNVYKLDKFNKNKYEFEYIEFLNKQYRSKNFFE